jgi:hypothetical protein
MSFHSRLTYAAQTGRITALCCCGGSGDTPGSTGTAASPWSSGTTVASGSSSGSLHLWRPEYTTRQGGVPDKYTGGWVRGAGCGAARVLWEGGSVWWSVGGPTGALAAAVAAWGDLTALQCRRSRAVARTRGLIRPIRPHADPRRPALLAFLS